MQKYELVLIMKVNRNEQICYVLFDSMMRKILQFGIIEKIEDIDKKFIFLFGMYNISKIEVDAVDSNSLRLCSEIRMLLAQNLLDVYVQKEIKNGERVCFYVGWRTEDVLQLGSPPQYR